MRFGNRPDAEIRFVAEGEGVGRLQARLWRGTAPLAGSAVVGLGPELYPFFRTEPRDSAGLRWLLAFQERRGECAVASGWDAALPTRPEHPEGVVRLEVRPEEGDGAAEAAFVLDIRPAPRTGRLRFLRTLPFVLKLRRLALHPERPLDFAREEGLAIALDAGGADPVREVLAAYERLGLP